jgi:hypothetical protein
MDARPAVSPDLVRAFVANAHGDLNQVQELLTQEPALINAAWDWGGGDWETALGAAAHMGRKDIAHYLLDHGARLDVFAAAMLGELAIIQIDVPGPHGIPLGAHAKAGGEDAAVVVKFLETFERRS